MSTVEFHPWNSASARRATRRMAHRPDPMPDCPFDRAQGGARVREVLDEAVPWAGQDVRTASTSTSVRPDTASSTSPRRFAFAREVELRLPM
jgi:hypothetical protein